MIPEIPSSVLFPFLRWNLGNSSLVPFSTLIQIFLLFEIEGLIALLCLPSIGGKQHSQRLLLPFLQTIPGSKRLHRYSAHMTR